MYDESVYVKSVEGLTTLAWTAGSPTSTEPAPRSRYYIRRHQEPRHTVSRLRRASAKGVMDRCRKIRKLVSFDRRRTDTRSMVDQKNERARNNDERKLSSSESSKGSLLFFGGNLLVYSAAH